MVSSGIEPLIPALLARCLNQLGQETRYFIWSVVLRARVIPECLDNPNINSLREVTSCQNSLSD